MILQAIVVIDSGEFASNSEDVLKVFWYRDKFDHITRHFEGGVVGYLFSHSFRVANLGYFSMIYRDILMLTPKGMNILKPIPWI